MFEEYWILILILNFILGIIVGLLIPPWQKKEEKWKTILCFIIALWILLGCIYFGITVSSKAGCEFAITFIYGYLLGCFIRFLLRKRSPN